MTLPHAALACALLLIGLSWSGTGSAQQVRISRLTDYTFTITNVSQNISLSRNACISATSLTGRYGIRATGGGTAGAFTLAGPAAVMAYDVQWNDRADQTSGTALVPGVARSGLTTSGLGLNLGCALGNDSASLILTLRSGDLSRATAGAYTGTLTLLIAAE
ncbi:hypothetical protein [Sphingomonas prati]|uniref:Spore coat protein U domain-containing protein n=1 Tax=Sphingomonas prati TaxID=1843237 RepID=A0A7W9BV60_9SPHN|nr:hypothetical protein [Sphingomonas prati]MBB5730707.1 hypothetical protein [Sphingomonas prati]GGE95812.1 hypothetical protein GCM10011404_31190 [Sphingomonas prati]